MTSLLRRKRLTTRPSLLRTSSQEITNPLRFGSLALLAIALFHRALTRVGGRDWALFGASCGVMMLAKFSAVVLFASFAGYLFWARRLQTPFPWAGIAIAAAVGIVVASPYLVSIVGNASAPQAYAMQSIFPGDANRIECLKTVWGFASSQVAKVMPALLIFAVLRRGAIPANAVPDQAVPLVPFLTLVGFGPFVLTVVIAALTGAHLLVGWGTTFHVLLTFWLVTARPLAFDVQPRALGRAALASVVVQATLWALTATHGGRLPNLNPTLHVVPPPTPAKLADAVRGIWAQHCAAALRYIVTDGHTGAALAIQYRGQPYAVDATRPEFTRFFPDAVRIAEGAVVVAPRPAGTSVSKAPANRLDQLIADAAWQMSVELPASDGRHHTYALGILPPSTGQGCEYAQSTGD